MVGAFRAFKLKAGFGKVICIRRELALQPGMAVYEEYPDLKDGKEMLDGDIVVEFHKLPEIQQTTLKVLRWEERDRFWAMPIWMQWLWHSDSR
jgi:hypothetical protein